MTRNIRRFAATASLALILAGTPTFAAQRIADPGRDRTPIVRFLQKIIRLIGLTPNADIMPPIPGPSTNP